MAVYPAHFYRDPLLAVMGNEGYGTERELRRHVRPKTCADCRKGWNVLGRAHCFAGHDYGTAASCGSYLPK